MVAVVANRRHVKSWERYWRSESPRVKAVPPCGLCICSTRWEDLELLRRVVHPLHWRMARAGKPMLDRPYIGPRGLVALWARASSPPA